MKNFYAHSLPDEPDKSKWQQLEQHLRQVAEKARSFAGIFKSDEWGYLAGLLHDLGKYLPDFQRRLLGERVMVEHSGCGGLAAFQRYGKEGLPLAFVVLAHHAGLPNPVLGGPDQPSPVRDRLHANEQNLKKILPEIASFIDLPLPELPSFLKQSPSPSLKRSTEFWIRFLFSALVDADRLDTEAFLEPGKMTLREGFVSLSALRRRLDDFINRRVADLSAEVKASPVNRLRARVLESCRQAAVLDPGCFSLTVPTGGGKTLSSMSFALLHAEKHGLRRIIVVIPYTSIIEQNAGEYRRALGADNVIEHHSNLDPIKLADSIGEIPAEKHALAAENWDAPIIVTTSVQFLESLFSNHPSRCRKLHNIARSVVIFDEVQTLPPGFLLSILDALNELTTHYGCSVVLSTATPPALTARERFPAGLKNVREIFSGKLAAESGLPRLKRVSYFWPGEGEDFSDWPELARELAALPQVLTVVHRRQDARELARALRDIAVPDDVFHLSALMCPAHRSEVLGLIRRRLNEGIPCRVVSTQLVEAGVDLDFPVVYRALGGLDSMVQAAGRCNREGRLNDGRVVIFRSPTPPPAGTPRKALAVASSMLAEYGDRLDPENPEVFADYFRRLYFTENLDAANIQSERQQFNFANVGRLFHLIEDGFSQSLVVPWGDSAARLQKLRNAGPKRETLRSLQPYTISVYPDSLRKLQNLGSLETLDGINALSTLYAHLYDPFFGLVEGDQPAADPEKLII